MFIYIAVVLRVKDLVDEKPSMAVCETPLGKTLIVKTRCFTI